MKACKFYVIVLLCIIFCVSCVVISQNVSSVGLEGSIADEQNRKYFYESASFPFPFPEELSTIMQNDMEMLVITLEQALYDYDSMWQMLEDNFPFFPYVESEMKIDWERIKTTYADEMINVSAQGQVSQENFIEVIDRCLQEFKSTGHLYVIKPSFYWQVKSSFEDRDDAPYANIYALMNNEKSERFYHYYKALLGAPTGETIGKVPAPVIEANFKNGIPYLKILSFRGWTKETYTQIWDWFKAISGAEHLIIDIRGNGGGDTGAWVNGLVAPLIAEPVSCISYMGVKTGPLNCFFNPQIAVEREQYKVYESERWSEFLPEKQSQYAHAIDAIIESERIVWPLENHNPYKFEKVWLLVDKGCYSAADQFAHFCQTTGFATLVGTFTAGNGIGMQPFVMALPNTGLCIYYEPFIGFNRGGTCNGIQGTAPDIHSGMSTNALQVCLDIIAKSE